METIYTTFAPKIRKYEVCRFAGATETLVIFCALRWVLTLTPSAYCPEYDFR